MKEAYGGIFNLMFIIIFLVIVIGVLGLTFSYTKAFKMKDAIIETIEEYEGTGCFPEKGGVSHPGCRNQILKKAQELGYSPVSLDCDESTGLVKVDGLYCYNMEKYTKKVNGIDRHYAIFTVVTQVDIAFPIIEHIMGFRIFQVAGDTREIMLQY